MSDRLKISRRDFLNGVALGVAAGSTLSPLELLAMDAAHGVYYPPALTGMRGSHPGSFEVAHALAWGGATWPRPATQTDATYDLVVLGGGISGLATAFFYRQRTGRDQRVLILDNHDDFGGHAKRNEFTVDGTHLIGYGGSQSIDTPGHYSAVAKQLLKDVAIDTQRFYDYFDRKFFEKRKLGRAIYFSAEAYGADRVAPNVMRGFDGSTPGDIAGIIAGYPLPEAARHSLLGLMTNARDLLPEHDRAEKIALLRRTSYCDFLRKFAGMPEEVVLLFRDSIKGLWGIGWDALSALEGYRMGMPGTTGLGIGELEGEPPGRDEPYIFHFPDGNAGVARSLVRQLVPDAVPGHTMEDLVTARVDYEQLDREGAGVRIRLSSTGVDVRHAEDGEAVDVTYLRHGEVHRVRGRHVVLACYNRMIPYLCSEVPEKQKEALAYAEKVPLVYINVALRNWRAFDRLGYEGFYVPQADLMHSFGMDFPVSMGGYAYTDSPDEPTVIHGAFVPTSPGKGLTAREQHVAGRRRLYEMSFDEFERGIVRQMDGALSGGGFDAERDIAAITVNRWPHGYAYEYNDYSDPPEYGPEVGPHIAGRARIGRISIANSDASAYAYVNGAIDAADRAVNEQIEVG
ncbi:MAG TPA: NAD(P)-binding protein [Woeseiaceae bacterium]